MLGHLGRRKLLSLCFCAWSVLVLAATCPGVMADTGADFDKQLAEAAGTKKRELITVTNSGRKVVVALRVPNALLGASLQDKDLYVPCGKAGRALPRVLIDHISSKSEYNVDGVPFDALRHCPTGAWARKLGDTVRSDIETLGGAVFTVKQFLALPRSERKLTCFSEAKGRFEAASETHLPFDSYPKHLLGGTACDLGTKDTYQKRLDRSSRRAPASSV